MTKETYEKAIKLRCQISSLTSHPHVCFERTAHEILSSEIRRIKEEDIDYFIINDKGDLATAICALPKKSFLELMDLYKVLYDKTQEPIREKIAKLEKEFEEL